MKPILFPAGQTDFTTNGLSRLSSAISCTVTEERNGVYELHMECPIDGHSIEEITYSRIILATPADKGYGSSMKNCGRALWSMSMSGGVKSRSSCSGKGRR